MKKYFAILLLFFLVVISGHSLTMSQRAFVGGEITPSLYGRVDIEKYRSGLKTLRNMFVKKHGGTVNRPGTVFVGEVSYPTTDDGRGGATRLIPFIFSDDQTYVIEMGHEYMRFIQDGAYVLEDSYSIVSISEESTGQIHVNDHGLNTGDYIYISGLTGIEELNARTVSVTTVSANHFTIHELDGTPIDTTDIETYSSGGTIARIYTVSNASYDEAHLFDVNYIQSADVITFASSSYPPKELTRLDNDDWTFEDISFVPTISIPGNLAVTCTAGGSTDEHWYQVTAFDESTGEESLPARDNPNNNCNDANSNAHTITWDVVPGVSTYNLYRERSGTPGFLSTITWQDGDGDQLNYVHASALGAVEDYTDTPPTGRNPFAETTEYPNAVAYVQQRLSFGGSVSYPQRVDMSRTGRFKNFSITIPTQDDDSVQFDIVGKQNQTIKHMVDLGKMVVFTTNGEWNIGGDAAGIIGPSEVNAKQQTYNGSGKLQPLVINDTAIYLQERGSYIRDLAFNYQTDGFTGDELTIYSSHLFEGYTLVDWAYQKIPDSIVWAVRSDGVLLSLTYNRAQQMLAWARHDFQDAAVESIAVIPEGTEDSVYLLMKRTINGDTHRYIEKLSSRFFTTILDAKFMDSNISYDGRNTDSTLTVSLTGGSTWAYDETVGLTANHELFDIADIGKEIHMTGSDGTEIRFAITSYVDTSSVRGKPQKTIPSAMRNVSISDWSTAIKTLTGLWHLEGESLSVVGDGFVEGSPNNADYTTYTVSNASVQLDSAYSVIHAGLPYLSDIETLNINSADGESLSDRKMKADSVTMFVEKTRGVWAGSSPPDDDDTDPLEDLRELKIRNEESMDDPIALYTGIVNIPIPAEWNDNGRVFIRQVEPLPMSILTIEPNGWFPVRNGRGRSR